MSTARNARPALELVKEPEKPFTRQEFLKEPEAELNPDQQVMRTVCEEAFQRNVTAMATALKVTPPALRKYFISGETSPDWEMMQAVGALVGKSVDQLRSVGRGELFVAGTDKWVDTTSSEWDEIRLRLINWASSEADGELDL